MIARWPHIWAAHLTEYAIDGALLGVFMIAACTTVVVFCHPASPVSRRIRHPVVRRAIIGILMGLTGVALIYSPWGQRSGAHMNPGTTLAFLLLGKVTPADALGYMAAQFAGGLVGTLICGVVAGGLMRHPWVRYAVTEPGAVGARVAFVAEAVIAFLMMSMVLWSSNVAAIAPYTGVFAGVLLAMFITVEAPLSGMSLNPARTLASAALARAYRGLWLYFTAPPLGMALAAGMYAGSRGLERVYCAKLNHAGHERCIFDCRIDEMPGRAATRP